MAKPKWNKYTLPMPAAHTWKCAPGYRIFIADRGAVWFEVPEPWIHGPEDDGSIGFHDRKPPDDDVSLKTSVMRLPPQVDLPRLNREMPVQQMVLLAIEADRPGGHPDRTFDGVVHTVPRPNVAVAWVETTDPDRDQPHRLVRTRTLLARAGLVQPLITFACWADLTERFDPAWDHLLATLRVAVPVGGLGGESAN